VPLKSFANEEPRCPHSKLFRLSRRIDLKKKFMATSSPKVKKALNRVDDGKSPSLTKILHDPKRLDVLMATGLLDTPPEQAFDRLTHLATLILNAPVSLVSLVEKDFQFFKSQKGLPEPWASERSTPLSHSFCQHVVASASPLVVADARQHPLLQNNDAIRDLKVIAYLGIPLTTPEGQTLGSFCTIDAQPRVWTEREIEIMKGLAGFVMNEVELRLLARHFHANYLELRDLELEREEMVQMLVHDLRNPLSSLLMELDLLDAMEDSETGRECLRGAQKGAQSLLRMVNDILDISKSQAGRLHLDLSDVAAGDIVNVACTLMGRMAADAGIKMKPNVPAGIPVIRADKEKIRRVLVNLISNAIQHTQRNGEIEISVQHDPTTERITFKISDTGTGIPKEAFGQIFEKFSQSKVKKTDQLSTGLGLSFCKMAAEAHGGTISVESELGRGTTFRFEIPEKSQVRGEVSLQEQN
jgi:signal transduction histidine kinase